MNYIYIVNKKGKPLMPTTRHAHIRKLLRTGKAVAINGSTWRIATFCTSTPNRARKIKVFIEK